MRPSEKLMKALLRNVPDLQDFDGLAADPISEQIITMQHQFAGAFEIAASSEEGMPGQMLGGVFKASRQRARRLRVVLSDEIQNLLQVGKCGARPFKVHNVCQERKPRYSLLGVSIVSFDGSYLRNKGTCGNS